MTRISCLESVALAAKELQKLESYMNFYELQHIPGVREDIKENPGPGNKLAEALKNLEALDACPPEAEPEAAPSEAVELRTLRAAPLQVERPKQTHYLCGCKIPTEMTFGGSHVVRGEIICNRCGEARSK